MELYKKIAATPWRSTEVEILLFTNLDTNSFEVPTVHGVYREHFSEVEWNRILIFETYFHNLNPDYLTFENSIKEKLKLFDVCQKAEDLRNHCASSSSAVIKNREKRLQSSQSSHIRVKCPLWHVLPVLDCQLKDYLINTCTFNVMHIVTVNTDSEDSITVHVELTEDIHNDITGELSNRIISYLIRNHAVRCGKIYFFPKELVQLSTDRQPICTIQLAG